MKKCSKCFSYKPLSEFYKNCAECKDCHALRGRKYAAVNKEKLKVSQREWAKTESGKESLARAQKKWRANNPGEAQRRAAEWRMKNYDRAIAKQREIDRRYKLAAYAAYGGFICSCCGETMEQFLSIDHINNDGANHRRNVPRRNLYKWLKANDYPSGFQILCMNCNFGKARNNGICPHKTSEGSETIPKGSTAKRREARSTHIKDGLKI